MKPRHCSKASCEFLTNVITDAATREPRSQNQDSAKNYHVSGLHFGIVTVLIYVVILLGWRKRKLLPKQIVCYERIEVLKKEELVEEMVTINKDLRWKEMIFLSDELFWVMAETKETISCIAVLYIPYFIRLPLISPSSSIKIRKCFSYISRSQHLHLHTLIFLSAPKFTTQLGFGCGRNGGTRIDRTWPYKTVYLGRHPHRQSETHFLIWICTSVVVLIPSCGLSGLRKSKHRQQTKMCCSDVMNE